MTRPPRRISVKGKPGIYFHLLASGERAYEFSYTDWRGRRRWKTVAGGLEDAEAAREENRSRLRKGEKIGPTKATLTEVYRDWLKAQTKLRPRTHERYEGAFEQHVLPRFGHRRISAITVDDVAALVRAMEEGYRFRREGEQLVEEKRGRPYAGWSIRATLTPFSKVMGYAVRRGLAATNPVKQLEGDERPEVEEREKRILEKDEIAKLLAAAPQRYHALLATAVFTGCRLGELLGLTWADVDLEAGEIHVRMQLGRDGRRVREGGQGGRA